MCRIVCRTGDVTSVMEGQVVITIGDLTDSWSGIFKYQVNTSIAVYIARAIFDKNVL